jgi:hypothetical protein
MVQHLRLGANRTAHGLAKEGLRYAERNWINGSPDYISFKLLSFRSKWVLDIFSMIKSNERQFFKKKKKKDYCTPRIIKRLISDSPPRRKNQEYVYQLMSRIQICYGSAKKLIPKSSSRRKGKKKRPHKPGFCVASQWLLELSTENPEAKPTALSFVSPTVVRERTESEMPC